MKQKKANTRTVGTMYESESVSRSFMSVSLRPHGLSMEFPRQEYWSALPFPSPGDLPDPGIKHRSPALEADSLTSEPPGKSTLSTGSALNMYFSNK